MGVGLSKSDLADADVLDAEELNSVGTVPYAVFSVTSTTSGTKTVTIALDSRGRGLLTYFHRVRVGDTIVLAGTSGANGTYTVASIVDNLNLTVVESINTSTGGTASLTYYYLSVSVVSTTNSTKVVVVGTPSDGEGIKTGRDHLVQVGDRVILSGTSGGAADGTYTVENVIDDTSFKVTESLATSTGGTAKFRYAPGAYQVGADPSNFNAAVTTKRTVQGILDDLGIALGSGVVTGVPPNFQQAASEGVSTTTSATFQDKVTLTTGAGDPAGTYYILFYNESAVSAANKQYEVQLTVDGTTQALLVGRPSLAGVYTPFSGFYLIALTAGVHTIKIQYRRVDSTTLSIKRARIGYWRVI